MTDRIITRSEAKTVRIEGDTVLKIFDERYSKADILNEALNQARAEETELNVPKILEVLKVDGKWAIRTEYIPGKNLEALMKEHPEKNSEYLEMMVDLQMQMHRQTSPLMTKLKEKMIRKIAQTDLDATTRYELNMRLDGMPKHKKVLHGDFNPSNIIVGEDGKLYIIDWSHATQGNASADVARTYLLFRLEGKDAIAEEYLNLFCKKSDTAKQYVQKWMPIVAASQSVKGKPGERAFLLSWVDVAEYQ